MLKASLLGTGFKVLRRENPLRRLLKILFLRTCAFDARRFGVKIRVYDNFYIYLHPTAFTLAHWLNRESRVSDYSFITSYLKPDDVYIDVGSNIGTTLIPAAKVLMHGTAIGFEPQPKIFSYLQNNVALNRLKNVELHNCALGMQRGRLTFSSGPTR